MSNRLREILEPKRTEIARLSLAEQQARAAEAPTPRDFLAAVTRPAGTPPRLIAELKRDLALRLRSDGFTALSQAVGADR